MDLRLLPVRAHRADAQCIHTRVRRERLAQGARQKRQRCLTDSVSNGRRNGSEATPALDRNDAAFAMRLHVISRQFGQPPRRHQVDVERSEEHTSELQSLLRISYAVLWLQTT